MLKTGLYGTVPGRRSLTNGGRLSSSRRPRSKATRNCQSHDAQPIPSSATPPAVPQQLALPRDTAPTTARTTHPTNTTTSRRPLLRQTGTSANAISAPPRPASTCTRDHHQEATADARRPGEAGAIRSWRSSMGLRGRRDPADLGEDRELQLPGPPEMGRQPQDRPQATQDRPARVLGASPSRACIRDS
jgi:hypothetical protein